ncbi:multi antimicrobial extrusion protein MatE [Halobacillus andaensis]|uniref:multi antimicrobial extrusion protein MatE n=1 Tax=Halobacillus andaensis TaxID=1176239 RepID=UPI003D740A2D
MDAGKGRLTYKQLCAFFIPLGFSASLTSITHVIINGTLSRGENAAFIIACYAVAFALFGIIERPIIVFRQTCSALVKDVQSFKALAVFMVIPMAVIMGFCLLMVYSSFGGWVYVNLFNADPNMVQTISDAFAIILFVIIFSGIRGIYQGVIINHLETKWLTIMVVIRLCVMFAAAYLFVYFDYITSAAGSILFLLGMLIECVISVWKGHRILNASYQKQVTKLRKREISSFYLPLAFYFVIQTVLVPVIYVFLAKTNNIEIGIASFALAFSITQMLLSFFMYTHQLVLQLYEVNKEKVIRFIVFISMVPTLALSVLCYTPAGLWFMEEVMGADEELTLTTIAVLKFFIIKTLVFPWLIS